LLELTSQRAAVLTLLGRRSEARQQLKTLIEPKAKAPPCRAAELAGDAAAALLAVRRAAAEDDHEEDGLDADLLLRGSLRLARSGCKTKQVLQATLLTHLAESALLSGRYAEVGRYIEEARATLRAPAPALEQKWALLFGERALRNEDFAAATQIFGD